MSGRRDIGGSAGRSRRQGVGPPRPRQKPTKETGSHISNSPTSTTHTEPQLLICNIQHRLLAVALNIQASWAINSEFPSLSARCSSFFVYELHSPMLIGSDARVKKVDKFLMR